MTRSLSSPRGLATVFALGCLPLFAGSLGCQTDPELGLAIRLPDDQRLLASVTQVNLSASRDGVLLAQHTSSVASGYVSLTGVAHGERTIIGLDGLDASNRIIARGRTCPLDFTAAGQRASLYFAPTNFFAPTLGAPVVTRDRPVGGALDDGSVLVAAGAAIDGTPLASAERFTVADAAFATTAAGLVTARRQAESVVIPSIGLLITGGLDAAGAAIRGGELYFTQESQFLSIEGLDARVGHRLGVLSDGRALVTGGALADLVPQATSAIVYVLSDGTYRVSAGPPLAAARRDHAMVIAGSRALVIGGYGVDGTLLTSIESLDPAATVSSPPIANLQIARAGATASVLSGGSVLIAGGVDAAGQPLDSAELLSPFASETTLYTMAAARAGHSATVLSDGRVLIAGGVGNAGVAIDSVELFSEEVEFVTERTLKTARSGHLAIELCDETVLFVGGGATAELYTEPSL